MKNTTLNYYTLKNFIKKEICFLPNYSVGEEDLVLQETFNLTKDKLLFKTFSNLEFKKIKKIVKKRRTGKPLNKIFKHSFFYKDDFYINNHVLAPRQETELLVENALKIINNYQNKNLNILDLCCGSGVIGLSVAKNSDKNCFVVLSDVSKKALKVTYKNKKRLGIKENVKIVKSDLFNNLKEENKFDIILSNPPYIETESIKSLDCSVKNFDPIIALDGGSDGLKFYKQICEKAKNYLTKNGFVIVEIGFNQKKQVEKLFKEKGFYTKCVKDFSNNDRIIIANLR